MIISNGKFFEMIHLGDDVTVIFDSLGVSSPARCTSIDYNVLTGRYSKIELGTPPKGLDTTISNLSDSEPVPIGSSGGSGSSGSASRLNHNVVINATGDVIGASEPSDMSGSEITVPLNLSNTGVTAGIYTAVSVDAKGRVIAGKKAFELGALPSEDLINGGIFFWDIDAELAYTITGDILYGSLSDQYDSTITPGANAWFAIIPNQNYTYPDEEDIVVTNASLSYYDATSGVGTIIEPTGNVTISATCVAVDSWEYPVQVGSTLHITQVYDATKTGETLTLD